MDLDQYTVLSEGDTDLVCARCPSPSNIVASSHGVLGGPAQLPNPITFTALLTAANRHDAQVHRRG